MKNKKAVMINTGDAAIEVVLQGEKGPLIVMLPSGGRGADDFNFLSEKLTNAGWRIGIASAVGGSIMDHCRLVRPESRTSPD